jgi:hypothetical protein
MKKEIDMNIRHSARVAALSLASAAVAASAALAVAAPASASTLAPSSQSAIQVAASPQTGSYHHWYDSGERFYDYDECDYYGSQKVYDEEWGDYRCERHQYRDRHHHGYRYYWKLYYQEYSD